VSLAAHQPTYNQPKPPLPSEIVFGGVLDSMEQRTYHKPQILAGVSDLRPKTQPRAGLDFDVLNKQYVMRKAAAIQKFVSEHRLRSLLIEARSHLDRAFGNEAIKKLEIIRDDEGYETLYCSVIVTGGVGEARFSLQTFDDQWWVERCNQVNGKLNFDFELG
jgi:hypothetical protein